MDTKAKDLFERNPEVETLHKVKGKSIYFSSEEGAKAHKAKHKEELEVLDRADFFEEDDESKPSYPAGEPSKAWTREELVAYGNEKYPELKLQVKWKEDTILSKLAEAAKAPAE